MCVVHVVFCFGALQFVPPTLPLEKQSVRFDCPRQTVTYYRYGFFNGAFRLEFGRSGPPPPPKVREEGGDVTCGKPHRRGRSQKLSSPPPWDSFGGRNATLNGAWRGLRGRRENKKAG